MTGTDVIKMAIESSGNWLLAMIEDMRDAPLTFPTPNGGNHPLWIIGHLTWSEGMFRSILFGEPNPVDDWTHLFGAGTEPTDNPDDYPPLDEILARFKPLREQTLKYLDTLTDDDLDKPTTNPPEGFEKIFGTCGQLLLLTAMHTMTHRGQITDARRALGRKPLMA